MKYQIFMQWGDITDSIIIESPSKEDIIRLAVRAINERNPDNYWSVEIEP